MSVLIIAAHPDDEVLGCGGTIARLAQQGKPVDILILGEGITSRYGNSDVHNETKLNSLHTQAHRVGDMLGARSVTLAKLPDNQFDTIALLSVVRLIEGSIERLQPSVVYTQHGGDLNVDHAVTFRATLTATRALAGCSVRSVYAYEVRSSTEWAHQQFAPVFHPNTFVDISDTLEMKIAAMQHYESEARDYPHPRSPQALRATAQYWGSVSGMPAAEAFQLIRSIEA